MPRELNQLPVYSDSGRIMLRLNLLFSKFSNPKRAVKAIDEIIYYTKQSALYDNDGNLPEYFSDLTWKVEQDKDHISIVFEPPEAMLLFELV